MTCACPQVSARVKDLNHWTCLLKIVFSRKGFDSGFGGCPSPIFPDGQMVSLPIPGGRAPWRYEGIQGPTGSIGEVVRDLTGGQLRGSEMVHLDPDLDAGSIPRKTGWRASLGQAGAAQTHLTSQGVGPGDLMMFFGWFRPVEKGGDRWHYVRSLPAVHALFGYLQIGQSMHVGAGHEHADWAARHPWLHDHPHLHGERSANNTIHVASNELVLPHGPTGLPGAGAFSQLTPDLVLTAPGVKAKSLWQLPGWLAPGADGVGRLSYHGDSKRWTRQADGSVWLQTVAKGQEFVMDVGDDSEASAWLRSRCNHTLRGPVSMANSPLARPRRHP